MDEPHVIFIENWPRPGDMWPYGGRPTKAEAIVQAGRMAAFNPGRRVWVAPFGTMASGLEEAAVHTELVNR